MFVRIMLCAVFSAVLAGPLVASELSRSKAELELLQQNISALQETLDKEREQEASITSELDRVEQELSRLRNSIRKHNQRKEELERRLTTLTSKAKLLEANNADALIRLSKLIRSGYAMGKQSGLRLLINQQDLDSSARRLTMFRYVMQARNRQLAEILTQTQEIRENRALITDHQVELDNTLESLGTHQEELKSHEQERQSQLVQVRGKMNSGESTIAVYQEREKSLKKLLAEISRRTRKSPQRTDKIAPQSTQKNLQSSEQVKTGIVDGSEVESSGSQILAGFGDRRGQLPVPIKAAIAAKFGQKKPESGLRWEGVLFDSKEGQPVEVIYPGQVVFSDWFRGYGQLMVVDHGDGYMSLYGHNQELQAVVGESVSNGQVIAIASDGGNVPAPGLYFEIRHNGTPDDPLKWVR